jgi:hypothetical protein
VDDLGFYGRIPIEERIKNCAELTKLAVPEIRDNNPDSKVILNGFAALSAKRYAELQNQVPETLYDIVGYRSSPHTKEVHIRNISQQVRSTTRKPVWNLSACHDNAWTRENFAAAQIREIAYMLSNGIDEIFMVHGPSVGKSQLSGDNGLPTMRFSALAFFSETVREEALKRVQKTPYVIIEFSKGKILFAGKDQSFAYVLQPGEEAFDLYGNGLPDTVKVTSKPVYILRNR